ncbi:MAG: aspartyl/asparaginyl beta-hydroxylase domain-containing protein [Planctomycetota bacterium]
MFVDIEKNFPALKELEKHYAALREEVLAVPFSQYTPWADPNAYAGGWAILILFTKYPRWDYGKQMEQNRLSCPKTWDLVKDLPGKVMVGFSYQAPHTHVYPHRDLVDDDVLKENSIRCHMGIKVPAGKAPIRAGDQVSQYVEGKWLGFDGVKFEHEAGNLSDEPRVTLCVELEYDPAKLVV